jgi:uncharacterized protein with NAD-binding domain and iron-sulfur cluster
MRSGIPSPVILLIVKIIVIGGGIVGLATAYRLGERMPGAEITLLEKESEVGRHQTGHNSALRPVLQARVGEGAVGRAGHPPDGGILPGKQRAA